MSGSFVMNNSFANPRLQGASPTQQRKKRMVSNWAKQKNMSFVKSREDMLQKHSSSNVVP